jgi:hypothetical protein
MALQQTYIAPCAMQVTGAAISAKIAGPGLPGLPGLARLPGLAGLAVAPGEGDRCFSSP